MLGREDVQDGRICFGVSYDGGMAKYMREETIPKQITMGE